MFGGGCGVDRTENLWHGGKIWVFNFDLGNLTACSTNYWHVVFHLICAAVNFSLTFAILNRLLKCQADYYARYCHMLYFVRK